MLFPIIVPLSLIQALLLEYLPSGGITSWSLFGAFILLYPIIQAVKISYISSVAIGDELPRSACYRLAIKFWLPLLGLHILVSLAMGLGFVLLIIPGLIVFARLMFSAFYCLLYEQNIINAFTSSWKHTKEYQWVLLVGVIVIAIATSLPVWLFEIGVETLSTGNVFAAFIASIIQHVSACLMTLFAFRIFMVHIGMHNRQGQ